MEDKKGRGAAYGPNFLSKQTKKTKTGLKSITQMASLQPNLTS